jgi:16S rRNA U1498 N3-methylase RsmE
MQPASAAGAARADDVVGVDRRAAGIADSLARSGGAGIVKAPALLDALLLVGPEGGFSADAERTAHTRQALSRWGSVA